jgi:large subunit ribosomal protein L5
MITNLSKKYRQSIVPQLTSEFGEKNLFAVPKIEKVIVSMGLNEAVQDKGVIEKASLILTKITGQKPQVTRARISIAAFKLRAGDPLGLKVTLRGERMYSFLEKLFKIVLPRLRDFQGVSLKGFDSQGNCNLGLPEQIVFPEINYEEIDKVHGLQITIVTSTADKEKAKRLLELLGMPFEKSQGVPTKEG